MSFAKKHLWQVVRQQAVRNEKIPANAGSPRTAQSNKVTKQPARHVPPTTLAPSEVALVKHAWGAIVGDGRYATNASQLQQLLTSLQIPQQPVTTKLCEESFNAKNGQFSFGDALNLLEQCKTVHTRWLCKLHGKRLDDDLLEAFVAVGGSDDSTGEVDIAKMKSVVAEFNLNVNLDKIVAELDSEGNSNIHFDDFAGLLRERRKGARLTDDEQVMSVEGVDEGIGFAAKKEPVVLSAMAFLDEDADFDDPSSKDRAVVHDHSPRRATIRRSTVRTFLPPVTPTQTNISEVMENAADAAFAQQLQLPPAATAFYKGSGGLRRLVVTPGCARPVRLRKQKHRPFSSQ